MVYYFDSRDGHRVEEPAAINLALPVATRSYLPIDRELPYWPSYVGMTPGQRRIYLEWLATGRDAVPAEMGYAFVFIYGLERRALVDQQDHAEIFDEVLRLRSTYDKAPARSRSFDSYTTNFLCLIAARWPQQIHRLQIDRLMTDLSFWTEDILAALLSWFAATETSLADSAAYKLSRALPQSQRSVIINRVAGEFERLFRRRFQETYPNGLALATSKRPRRFAYRPASAALSLVEISIANPLGLSKQFQALSDIWNGCIAELRKLSTAVTKASGTLTAAGWEAMPVDLKSGVDHPSAARLCELVDKHMRDSGLSIINAEELASALELPVDGHISLAQSRKLCSRASDVGYNIEPDARLAGKTFDAGQPVAVFLKISDQPFDATKYNAAVCMLRLASVVVEAGGAPDPSAAEDVLHHVTGAFDLNEDESRRLGAVRDLLKGELADLRGISRVTKKLEVEQRQAIGRLAIALAAADGVITPAERKAVHKCYASLGFTKAEADDVLRSVMNPAEAAADLVLARAGTLPSPGEPLPAPPHPSRLQGFDGSNSLLLNKTAIGLIMRETSEVAKMLAEAMNVESGVAPDPVDANLPVKDSLTSGETGIERLDDLARPFPQAEEVATTTLVTPGSVVPPAPYAALYQELIGRPRWLMKDAEALARRHGHMLAGAVESLNEWSFERYGGQVFVEEGDELLLDDTLLV